MSGALPPDTPGTPKRPSRRLSLAGLSREVRYLAVASIIAWSLVAALVITAALSLDPPGGYLLSFESLRVPRFAIPLAYAALACSSASLAYAALTPGWRFGWLTRIGLAICGLAFAGALLEVADQLESLREPAPGLPAGLDLAPEFASELIRLWGWISIAACAMSALPEGLVRGLPRPRASVALASALPYALGFSGCVLLIVTSRDDLIPADNVVGPPTVLVLQSIGFFIAALFLWQAVAGARVARDIGRGAARTLPLVPGALGAFVVLKLIWLALGLADLLPVGLGGENEALAASRGDDALSWVLVALLAGGCAWWLAKRCSLDARDHPLLGAAGFVSAMFLSANLIAAIAFLGASVAAPHVAQDAWIIGALKDLAGWFSDRQLAIQVVAVYAAGVAGVVVWRRGGSRAVAAFLILLSVLALPRAIGITLTWGDPGGAPGRFELASLDAAVTVGVAALLFGPWREHRRVSEAGLLVVVVASTAVAYAGTIVSAVWDVGAFYLALLLPVAYGLTLGARDLNEAGRGRTAAVLAATGGGAGLLAVVYVQLVTGLLTPGDLSLADVGRLLLAPPLAAVLVAIVCSRLSVPAASTARQHDARAPVADAYD